MRIRQLYGFDLTKMQEREREVGMEGSRENGKERDREEWGHFSLVYSFNKYFYCTLYIHSELITLVKTWFILLNKTKTLILIELIF